MDGVMDKTWLVMKICKNKEREIRRKDINRKRNEEKKRTKTAWKKTKKKKQNGIEKGWFF